MMILNKDKRTIKISMESMTSKCSGEHDYNMLYSVTAPKIICNNIDDADYIQGKLNEFVLNTCRELMK